MATQNNEFPTVQRDSEYFALVRWESDAHFIVWKRKSFASCSVRKQINVCLLPNYVIKLISILNKQCIHDMCNLSYIVGGQSGHTINMGIE